MLEGIDTNAQDHAGWTPLHEAVSAGHMRIAQLLLENGADPNVSATDGTRYDTPPPLPPSTLVSLPYLHLPSSPSLTSICPLPPPLPPFALFPLPYLHLPSSPSLTSICPLPPPLPPFALFPLPYLHLPLFPLPYLHLPFSPSLTSPSSPSLLV